MKSIFSFFSVLFILFLFNGVGNAQVIAGWDFTGIGSSTIAYTPATTFNSNLNSSAGANNITRGPGAAWSTANNSWRTVGFQNNGISTSNTDYFQVTLAAVSGYKLSLSTIDAKFAGTASFCVSPGVSSQFAYSLDGTNFTLIGSPQAIIGSPNTLTQINLSAITALQNVAAGTTVTLRYYASGQTTTGGWGFYSASSGTNGLAIGGSLAPVASASFTLGNSLIAFTQTSASPSAEQTYTINGTNLTNTVTITPPPGFEISKTTGTGFVNSTGNLTFTAAQVMANPTIYVRLNTASLGSYSGNITHVSPDFTTINQAVSGTNNAKCVLSLTALIQARYNGSVMVPDSVTVELHDPATLGLVDQDKEVLSASGTAGFTFNSALNGSSYYIVVKHRNSIETWSAAPQSFSSFALTYDFTSAAAQAYGNDLISVSGKYCIYSGDVNQDGYVNLSDLTVVNNDSYNQVSGYVVSDLNGDLYTNLSDLNIVNNNSYSQVAKSAPSGTPTPVFSVTGTLIAFSQTSSSAGAEQTYSIGGTNLTANVTLVPPAGFEISKTTGSGFVTSSGSLVYTAAEVMAGKTIYVRLHAGSPGGYSGNITHTSANSEFTQAIKSVSGTYTAAPAFTITGTLTPFSQTSSTPSAEQTYTIGGTSLTANVTLVPPAAFEISKTTGSGFVTSTGSLVYTAAEVMAGKTIYVRMNAPSSGSYSGNITHTSAGSEFTVQNQPVSGLYSVISANVNLIMGYPAPATTDVNNPHAFLLAKDVFCASYDRDRGIPNWTSWQLNSTWCNGPASRKDNYIPDPSLPSAWYHVNDADYSGSGFSRGHMCPSADRINTQNNNDSLFYYTNMVPQNQDNNAGDWEGLETYERTLANAGNTLYIISGGYGSGGKTQAGVLTTSLSGGKVIVPAQLWKVIIVIPNGTGTAADVSKVTTSTRTIAMLIPNDSTPNNTSTWGNYRVSVASVEALTGYTFFSNVPSAINNVIKAVVDSGPTN